MADEFILLVDDFWWNEVQEGTWRGIKEAGLNVEYSINLYNGVESDCSETGWWNGFHVALITK